MSVIKITSNNILEDYPEDKNEAYIYIDPLADLLLQLTTHNSR